MEASTTIRNMLAGNKIVVPDYQRAYSWDTDDQVATFLQDLEEFYESSAEYYLGHFLFEKRLDSAFAVVDGQQRIATIVIFLSALFKQLQEIRALSEKEQETFEDIIKRNSTYRFETVSYDNLIFKDYVIDQTKKDKNGIKTVSARRIVDAFDFFNEQLEDKDADSLERMLDIVLDTACTTRTIEGVARAAQMFIFQNERGKDPTTLELIKTRFMYAILLYGGEETEDLMEDIKGRFDDIYTAISSIESYVHENDILLYTLRVEFDSLLIPNPSSKIPIEIENELQKKIESISFITRFTKALTDSFQYATTFFLVDQQESMEIHSFLKLGNIDGVMPIIIKAYKLGLPIDQISQLCKSLESLILRRRLIGGNANFIKKINNSKNLYKTSTTENRDTSGFISRFIHHIDWMKKRVGKGDPTHWGWAYWNNEALESSIREKIRKKRINHSTARFLLWKYENHLRKSGQKGYKLMRFDEIKNPHLEHIAPQTKNEEPEAGYDEYDEEFRNNYLDCLGNYLLISRSHNISIGNKPFAQKLESYNDLNSLAQQREIVKMVEDTPKPKWTKELIEQRKEKIIKFILDEL